MLLDLVTGELDARFPPAPDGLLTYSGVQVSADGRFVAQLIETSAEPAANVLLVHDVASGRRVLGPLSLPFFASDVALNADGSLVAVAGGRNGDLAAYHVADGQLVGTVPGLAPPEGTSRNRDTAALAFGPDGRIHLGSMLGPIRVVDPTTLQVTATYVAPLLSSHNRVVVTSSGLLVAAGDEAVTAIDTSSGAALWTFERTPGYNACSSIAIAESSGRLYCRSTRTANAALNIGRVGRLEERDLATGLPTGVVFDPQQGTAGDVAITADERELVIFSHNAPALSHWRLDGTGLITTRVGQGAIEGGYDPTGTMMLVHHARSGADLFEDEPAATGADRYIWDPVADKVIDPIDDVVTARWAGPPGKLTAIFADGTAGLYDVTTHARVGPAYEFLDGRVTTFSRSADGSRLYFGYVDGRIQTFDSSTGTEVPPIIQTPGTIGTVAATTGGARVVATSFHNKEWSMTIHDAHHRRATRRGPRRQRRQHRTRRHAHRRQHRRRHHRI